MSYAARLKKLEQAAGKGQQCALCKLMLISSPPVISVFIKTRDASDLVKKTCWFCGNQYKSQLPQGDDPKDRAWRLYHTYDDEARYTDEKAQAVEVWLRNDPNRSPEESERQEQKRTAARARLSAVKLTPDQKIRQRLNKDAQTLYRRFYKEMKAKHGEPLTHIFELETKIASNFYKWHAASDEVERWRAWATLEKIIFDAPLPETEARISEYEEKAAAEAIAKEAEEQRREAERQAREQRMNSMNANRPQPSGYWG